MTEQERISSIRTYGGQYIKRFNEKNITYEMCLVAVQSDGKAIDFVPEQYRTKEVYLEACKNNGLMITKVPDSIISEEFYVCAVESNGNALKYIPLERRTKELCKKAAIVSPESYKFIPIDFVTAEFVVDVAQKGKYESVSSLPNSRKNNTFYFELVSLDPEFVWYIPRKALSAKLGKIVIKGMGFSSAAEAVKAKPELLSRLHVSLYDHDACLAFVESDYYKNSHGKDRYGSPMYGFNTQDDDEKGRLYLAQKYTETYSLPDMMKWPDVATKLLNLSGGYIRFIKKDIITEDICLRAIDSFRYALGWIPKEYRTQRICLYAFDRDPSNIEYFPVEYITEELVLRAVKHSGFLLKEVPEHFRTKEVCLIAVSDRGRGRIEDVPETVLDKEIILSYFQNTQWGFQQLKVVPEEMKDYDVCLAAVKSDGSNLQYVPNIYYDYNMCLSALNRTPNAYEQIPDDSYTEGLEMAIISTGQYEFKKLPQHCLTEAVCELAIKSGDKYQREILRYIPDSVLTQKLCDLSVKLYPHSFVFVPDRYVTEDLLMFVAQNDIATFKSNFPQRLRTKELCDRISAIQPFLEEFLSNINKID